MAKWMIRDVKYDVRKLVEEIGVSNIVAKLLVNRGLYKSEDIKIFLNPVVDNLYDGKQMKDICRAANIMRENIQNNKKILIVGDYDVDGVMSTFILYKGLKRLNANVYYHIPDRIKEGYGVNEMIIKQAKEDDIDLIITCDNGISAIEQIKLAKELGLKVIITDHHDIPFKEENGERKYIVPCADAVVNPKQLDCNYPFKNLCGAGVAYKFIQYLYEIFNIEKNESIELIQYVAIATICDVVDLNYENRIIVKKGLELLNNTSNIGLKALFKETGLLDKKINVYSVGFVIGPSINASGRLEQAEWALKLFLTDVEDEAQELANKLNELNKERQNLTKDGFDKAVQIIENQNMTKEKVLVVYLEEVHESIAGIIAGKIREKYNLPTIILVKTENYAKGSGRSIEEYNMFEELLKCRELLGNFGGHPMAAGMSIEVNKIDEFRKKLNDLTKLKDEDVIPKVLIDMQVLFKDINYELIRQISLLEPYGKGNSKPIFAIRNVMIKDAKILGKNENVLRLKLTDGQSMLDGIYFGDIKVFKDTIRENYGEEEFQKLFNGQFNNIKLDLAYVPDINEYNGQQSIQLIIQHYRMTK
jgi:single-stranded-DNA-specific exonuclease